MLQGFCGTLKIPSGCFLKVSADVLYTSDSAPIMRMLSTGVCSLIVKEIRFIFPRLKSWNSIGKSQSLDMSANWMGKMSFCVSFVNLELRCRRGEGCTCKWVYFYASALICVRLDPLKFPRTPEKCWSLTDPWKKSLIGALYIEILLSWLALLKMWPQRPMLVSPDAPFWGHKFHIVRSSHSHKAF